MILEDDPTRNMMRLQIADLAEAIRALTESLSNQVEKTDRNPNGLVAEIEDIKRRVSELERRQASVPEHLRDPNGRSPGVLEAQQVHWGRSQG